MSIFNKTAFISIQLQKIIALSFVLMIILLTLRVVTLLWLGPDEIFSEYKQDLFSTLVYSIRWDLKLFAIIYSPAFLLSILFSWNALLQTLAKQLTRIYFILSTVSIITLTLGNILYWYTYNNPLDVFAFGLFEDDTTEILKVLWNDYHPIYFSLSLFFFTFIIHFSASLLQNKISKCIPYTKKWTINSLLNSLYICIFFILARGSFSLFPLMDQTTIASNSAFLNQLSMNAPAHLDTAIRRKLKSTFSTSAKSSLNSKGYTSVKQASEHLLFKGDLTEYSVPLLFKSKSTYNKKAPNIIFVLMEGWSSQIVFDPKQSEDFLGEFKQHIDKGLFYKNFISTRQGTNRFLESTLANTSFFNLSTSLASNYQFKHSNISTLKNLNFNLGFIRGGSRFWYNQGEFWSNQGFDHYWDMTDIMQKYDVGNFSDWGVHDEFGFNFAIDKINEFDSKNDPYFLLVETTTNHPPHALPESYETININSQHLINNAINKNNTELQLHTTQYMTEQLGQFLSKLEENGQLENTIVIATGDHTLWAFNNYSQTKDRLFSGAVPLYIRLPKSLKPKWVDESISASHRDIFPTLFELAYPNAQYLKTGFDLFDQKSIHAGWHEKNIWIMENNVSIDNSGSTYQFDQGLKIDPSTKSTSIAMQEYKNHVHAMEALLQWQFKKEFEEFSKNDKSN